MFDRYIADYGSRLYGLCLRLCQNRWDAQDLYQETWLKAYTHYNRYDPSRAFTVWLSAICVNTYRDQCRRRKLLHFISFHSEDEQRAFFEDLPAPDPEDFSEVRAAVDDLPEALRLVVLLYYFHGNSVEETAETLRIPPGTVKSRLSRARALLKGRLTDE